MKKLSDEEFLKLCICQLALLDTPLATIEFFKNIFPFISKPNRPTLNTPQSADLAHVSRITARGHILKLQNLDLLVRRKYRSWGLSESPIKDSLLRRLL